MLTVQRKVVAIDMESPQFVSDAIYCYPDAEESLLSSRGVLSNEQLLAAQALQLLMRLDRELRETRADRNEDRFRRVMRALSKAVPRVQRRWNCLNPAPAIALGKLRRRYHSNLACSLYAREK